MIEPGPAQGSDRTVEPPSPRIFFWYDTTAHQPFETGIQRVTRRLGRALAGTGADLTTVAFDRQRRCIRAMPNPGPSTATPAGLERGDAWLLVTEIPIPAITDGVNPMRLGRAYGLRTAALVHDLIPMKQPESYDAATLRLFTAYYAMFAEADLAIATTHRVAGDLRAHLERQGLRVPEIAVVPLPAQFAEVARHASPTPARADDAPLRLLNVGTWEPRKNLPRLLRALRTVIANGHAATLTIVGKRSGFTAYEAEVEALIAGIPGVRVLERLGDAALAALYESHHASLYPSTEEGFGLPILESLWLATPCVCHEGSSMAEVAPGGGTLMVDMTDEARIAEALTALATQPDLIAGLTAEATARPLRTWGEMAADVARHLQLAEAP